MLRSGVDRFPALERFQSLRPLGRGGMGDVYRAHDTWLDTDVAVKVLHTQGADALSNIKREFRALTEVRHDNLIRLHELHVVGDVGFFTMDLVEGTSLGEYVVPSGVADVHRLFDVLWQLVDALEFLHASGIVHRDVKPSNIRICRDGRLVLLDFGIAALDREARSFRAGTPGYAAPEQIAGAPAAPSADWYSLGMLIQSLGTDGEGSPGETVATLPLETDRIALDEHSRARDARMESPGTIGLEDSLALLAQDLLAADPAARPDASEIRSRLLAIAAARGFALSRDSESARGDSAALSVPFVGREREIDRLRGSVARATSTPVLVSVEGPSGVGKTRLIEEWLAGLEGDGLCVIRSRCYEYEHVPFNALDAVVDGLGPRVTSSSLHKTALRPDERHALCVLFPALRPWLARLDASSSDPPLAASPRECRALGIVALTRLVREVSTDMPEHAPLVVFIDDVQHADQDSVALVESILNAGPRLLLVTCERTSGRSRGAAGSAWQGLRLDANVVREEITLSGLSHVETARLVASVAGATYAAASSDAMFGDCLGNPFFIIELLRSGPSALAERRGLDAVVRGRVSRLPAPSRALVEHLALVSEPIDLALIRDAAGLAPAACEEAVRDLTAAKLLRWAQRDVGRTQSVGLYHDRIREAVRAGMPTHALRALHARLARVLEAAPDANPDAVYAQWRAAGDRASAARYAERAADLARAQLAFERARRLYTEALSLCDGSPPTRLRLLLARAEASAGAGLGGDAARDLLAARSLVPEEQRAALSRAAAGHFVQNGYGREGIPLAKAMLEDAGLEWPATTAGTLAAVGARWVGDRIGRPMPARRRRGTETPERLRDQIEACWLLASGLSGLDPLRGLYFQQLYSRFASHSTDVVERVRALAIEAGYLASLGPRQLQLAARGKPPTKYT